MRAWGMLAAALAVVAVMGLAANWYYSALAVVFVALTLWRMWFPIVYRFEPQGIVQVALGRRRLISWSSIERYVVRRHGVLLVPHGFGAVRHVSRCQFIRWGGRREDVLEQLEFYLGPVSAEVSRH